MLWKQPQDIPYLLHSKAKSDRQKREEDCPSSKQLAFQPQHTDFLNMT